MKHTNSWQMALSASLVLAMLISLFAAFLPRTVQASESEDLKEQISELEKQQDELDAEIARLKEQLEEHATKLEAAVAQKDLLDQEIFLLHQQVQTIESQIAAYNQLIAQKQEELTLAQENLQQLQYQNQDRLRAMEKNGRLSYWSVLFRASSFMEMLDQMRMIRQIAEADRRCMEQLRDAAQAVSDAALVLDQEREALRETYEALQENQARLAQRREEADAALNLLLQAGQEFEDLLEQSEQEQQDLALEIAQKQDAYEDLVRPPQAPKDPPTTSPSGWVVPVDYVYMSSPFGMRFHPIHNEWRMHNGVDLAAYQGNPIFATRSGVVTTAAYEAGGAGYYVYINHGDGYGSIYMHMTHYIVSYGEYVEAGQVIGYCGSTGGSTGPHLHFGISYNGQYVNPADYMDLS